MAVAMKIVFPALSVRRLVLLETRVWICSFHSCAQAAANGPGGLVGGMATEMEDFGRAGHLQADVAVV